MASQLGSICVLGVPDPHRPVIRARQVDRAVVLVEERIAPQLVDWARVPRVRVQVLLRVRHRALVDSAVFRCREVVHVLLAVRREVNRQPACVDERHATALLLHVSAGVNVLLIGVGLPLELHQLGVLETLAERPLNDLAVTGNGNKTLALVLALHPLDVPDDVSVLVVEVLGLVDGLQVVALDVVNGDVAAGVTDGAKVWGLARERAANDAGVVLDELLREVGILEGPEAEEAGLEEIVVGDVDVSLTIADRN